MDVSGPGVTQQPSWAPFRVSLSSTALSLHSLEGAEVATLPLGDYEASRLRNNPDAAGCLLLQPQSASALSKADKSRARAWVRVQNAFDSSHAARGRELDLWKADFDRLRLAAHAEAERATHELLKASVGESAYLQAVEQSYRSRQVSTDGHLVLGSMVDYQATMTAPALRATLVAIDGAGDDTSYRIALPDGTEARTIRAKLRPAGAAVASALGDSDLAEVNRTLSIRLQQGMSGVQQVAFEARINAAGAVVKGATLTKFVLGRRKQHSRFFQVQGTGMHANVVWAGHKGRLLKAQASSPVGLQREQRLNDDELSRCFTIILEGKVLALMASTRTEKQIWVDGINAVAAGLLMNGQV